MGRDTDDERIANDLTEVDRLLDRVAGLADRLTTESRARLLGFVSDERTRWAEMRSLLRRAALAPPAGQAPAKMPHATHSGSMPRAPGAPRSTSTPTMPRAPNARVTTHEPRDADPHPPRRRSRFIVGSLRR
jgi:hypothetical protein